MLINEVDFRLINNIEPERDQYGRVLEEHPALRSPCRSTADQLLCVHAVLAAAILRGGRVQAQGLVAHTSGGQGHRPAEAEVAGSTPVCATSKIRTSGDELRHLE